MSEAESRDVFLSHTSADKISYVRPLACKLDERKVTYWLDEGEIAWGERISLAINRGLQASRYVLLFLTDSFIGRSWPETEMSAAMARENAEGRIVVLPLIIGNTGRILAKYPLIRDKAYLTWGEQGTSALADQLVDLIRPDYKTKPVQIAIQGTPHHVTCDLNRLLRFLRSLYWHDLYYPQYVRDELALCGLLADLLPEESGVIVNGVAIPVEEPNYEGGAGVPATKLAYQIFLLCSGGMKPETTRFAGVGPNYRALVSELAQLFGVEFKYSWN